MHNKPSEDRRELVIRADAVCGIFKDQDPGPSRNFRVPRIARVGSRQLADEFDADRETDRHVAALLLGVDQSDAKWLHGAGIPTELVLRISGFAQDWLSDSDWGEAHTARWQARLREAFPTPGSESGESEGDNRQATRTKSIGPASPTREHRPTPRIVVLTGAGISAESGISTFRDANGLWKNHRIEEVASPSAFAGTPGVVHEFYDARRRQAREALPNAAHYAIADLARELGSTGGGSGVLIVTQNVDDLHERAGSTDVMHIHGELNSALCTACGQRHPWIADLKDEPACLTCGARALRPDIVWFGEEVYHLAEIQDAVDHCETFIVVGTAGAVWPAAGLAARARRRGAKTILANLEWQDEGSNFDEVELGLASIVVPQLVKRILDLDYDPDSDWSETSPTLQRTSVYIDVEAVLAAGPFVLDGPEDQPARLPALLPGARDAVRELARHCNVVLVASVELAESPGFPLFWSWYNTHFGSYDGHLADQLLLTERLGQLGGWDFYIQSDWAKDCPPEWVGEIIRLGSKEYAGWSEVIGHIFTRGLQQGRQTFDSRAGR